MDWRPGTEVLKSGMAEGPASGERDRSTRWTGCSGLLTCRETAEGDASV